MKLALCNIENIATQKGILDVLEQHQNEIKLVINSDPYSKSKGGFLTQAWRNMTQRGYRFTEYLFVKMVLMHLVRPLLKACGFNTLPSLKEKCSELGIDYIKVKNVNDPQVIALLKKHQVDLLTIYYFDQILQPEIIEAPSQGVVNFHPAYLPKCRGLFPVMFSFLYNQQKYGISAHWIENTEIDAGPIIDQHAIEVTSASCLLEIDHQVSNQLPSLYKNVIQKIRQEKPCGQLQNTETSYYSYPKREDIKALRKNDLSLVNLGWVFKTLRQ